MNSHLRRVHHSVECIKVTTKNCIFYSFVLQFHVLQFRWSVIFMSVIFSRPTCMYSIVHVDMYVFFMSSSLCPSYRWGRVVGPSVRAYAYVKGRRHSQTGLPTASSLCMCIHTVNKLDPPKKRTTRCGAQFNVSPPGCATSHWRDDSLFRG